MFFKRIGSTLVVSWRLLRVFRQMAYGYWRISKLQPPVITIFGGSKLKSDAPYAILAQKFAKMCIDQDIDLLTGGGPGIMEAASCAGYPAVKGKGVSIGIGVTSLNQPKNNCVAEYFELDYFFARKWLLTRFSIAFVVFPGGFGTLDELAEILSLIRTKKTKRVPLVLIGTEFWNPFVNWLKQELLIKHGTIEKEDLDLLVITDDLDYAFSLVCTTCNKLL